MPQNRKVLFIVTDQFRADCIDGSLAQYVNLPNIQALRDDAVTFTNHYAVASPCGPSRASLLTGLYAMNHRSIRNGTPMDNAIANVALQARGVGYNPLLYGYTDTSLDPRVYDTTDPKYATEEQVMPGFTEKLEMRYATSKPWLADLKSKGYDVPDLASIYVPVSPVSGQSPKIDDPAFYKAQDSDTAFMTDRLLADLSKQTDENWFAHVAYIRPHPPLVAPEPYNKMYNARDLPLPARLPSRKAEAAMHPLQTATLDYPNMESITRGFSGQLDPTDDSLMQTLRALYLGLATEIDTHIGRIITFLKETGQYDDTVIVLTSDHGEMLGEHYMWGKQTVFDASYHIPLIIRDPRLPQTHGTNVNAFTESVDVTPTILDLIDADIPVAMDGHSVRPFMEGNTPDTWRDYVHLELDFGEPDRPTRYQNTTGLSLRQANLCILREKKYKLVHFNGGLPPLLFDLHADPKELVNLANDPGHSATVLRLTQKLLSHKMRCADHTLSDMKNTKDRTLGYNRT